MAGFSCKDVGRSVSYDRFEIGHIAAKSVLNGSSNPHFAI